MNREMERIEQIEAWSKLILWCFEIILMIGVWFTGTTAFVAAFAAIYSTTFIDFASPPLELARFIDRDSVARARKILVMYGVGLPLLAAAAIFAIRPAFIFASADVMAISFISLSVVLSLVGVFGSARVLAEQTNVDQTRLTDFSTVLFVALTAILGGIGIGYYINASGSPSSPAGSIAISLIVSLTILILIIIMSDSEVQEKSKLWRIATPVFTGMGLFSGLSMSEFWIWGNSIHLYLGLVFYVASVLFIFALGLKTRSSLMITTIKIDS